MRINLADVTGNTYRNRLSGDAKRGLKFFLLSLTNGKCAICAKDIDLAAAKNAHNAFAMSHVIPACFFSGDQEKRPGWISGNLFAGCQECNTRTGKRDLSPAIPAFRIPAGIGTWTDSEMARYGANIPVQNVISFENDILWSEINAMLG